MIRLKRTRHTCVKLLVAILLSIACYVACLWSGERKHRHLTDTGLFWANVSSAAGCRMPHLPVDADELKKFFQPTGRLHCNETPAWLKIRGSQVMVEERAVQQHGRIECTVSDVLFKDDWTVDESESVLVSHSYTLNRSDYIRVSCTAGDGSVWNSVMAGVRKEADIDSKSFSQLDDSNLPVNILIWGFDSLSRNTYNRKLPKTVSFLRHQLEAITLEGYNIVGDGTPAALTPILTGKTEEELPDVRRSFFKRTDYVNVYPMIWKDFERDGYVTAYNEDQPDIGTYNYRLNGFNPQPTHHYMRIFFLAAKTEIGRNKKYCTVEGPRHKVMMNYIESLYEIYPDKPKFIFSFHGELSHDDANAVGFADDDLVEFLQRMRSTGSLNNTILIMMADHGHRFTAVRNTLQGKQEERLPFFSYVFPKWFTQKYPRELSTFRRNAHRLTTPFDQHYTIQHLRSWGRAVPKDRLNRGQSLFTPVPSDRSCSQAGIDVHWCACLHWRNLPVRHSRVLAAAKAFTSYVNRLVEREEPGMCEPIHVEEILVAEEMDATLLQQRDNEADTRQPVYQLRMRTQPGDALFETSLFYDALKDEFLVKHQDISRTNQYGQQARCVNHRMDFMRKICYCRAGINHQQQHLLV